VTQTAQTGGTSAQRSEIELELNGERARLRGDPRWTLADALREEARLTGVHLGCEHGVCGACTVLLDGQAVRSCLLLALQAEGHSVRTVEGLARDDDLHPLQRAFHEEHALQCGYCTPGFLMLAVGLLETEPDASEQRIREVLGSNLCRCTGGLPAVRAVRAAQQRMLEAP
jgi:aerobic carbon-monoxide dehydrogenase small subunit